MANGESVRSAYTGIIDLLPVDWQRFVNDQLPYLESLIDQEVERFGRELAEYLVRTVDESSNRGKADVANAEEAMESALKELETSRRRADEGLTSIQSLDRDSLRALHAADAADVVSTSLRHANALRSLLDRLREDLADGRVQGLATYEASLEQWWESATEADLVTDDGLQALVEAAVCDLAELRLPEPVIIVPTSSALQDELVKAESLQRQIVDALDATPKDDQPLARLERALGELADELEEAAAREDLAGAGDGWDDVLTAAEALDRAITRAFAPLLPDVVGLAKGWIASMAAAREEDEAETARESSGASEDVGAVTGSPVAPVPDGSTQGVSASAGATSGLPDVALAALRESLTQLQQFVDQRMGLPPRIESIKESHAGMVERVRDLVSEAKHSESSRADFNTSRLAVLRKRRQLLRDLDDRTEEIAGKVIAKALALKAERHREALADADDCVSAFGDGHRAASEARRRAVTEIESARRSLAGSGGAYEAVIGAVRAGAQAAKLPILREETGRQPDKDGAISK